MNVDIRVRYAPSPTGHLHIGNARTALFNYLFARRHKGTFVIRIEDTDSKRNVEGGEQNQLRFLQWLGIDWDESVDGRGGYGPYRQSERLAIYRQYWQKLIDEGKAYRCYCTEDELEQEREAQSSSGAMPGYSGKCRHLTVEEESVLSAEGRVPSIRFRVPEERNYTFTDMVKGEVSFDADGIGDFVIVKKDGVPTYNFAVAIDDHLMEISHVLRGDDHISNTPRQLMIYEALGWKPPVFGHMSLIVNEQHKKLSKRDESILQFIEQYHDRGYLPEALFNFIALLGWSPGGEEELFTKDDLIACFDEHRLSRSPAVFDTQKLDWMNNQYMKKADLDRLVQLAIPHLRHTGHLSNDELTQEQSAWVRELVGLQQERMTCASDIAQLSELFFTKQIVWEPEAEDVLTGEQAPEVLHQFRRQLVELVGWDVESIKAAIKAVQKDTGLKGKSLFMPIRAALTGQTHGPDLNRTLYLLGKNKLLERLKAWM